MRYLKQHPDLPTETCKACNGHGHLYVDVDEACAFCNGTGRVSPYSPFSGIGDEVEFGSQTFDVAAVSSSTVDLTHGTDYCTAVQPSHLTLIKPCLDTPERQALQRQLEK